MLDFISFKRDLSYIYIFMHLNVTLVIYTYHLHMFSGSDVLLFRSIWKLYCVKDYHFMGHLTINWPLLRVN